jgi:DNA-binding transcriptional LysR family regulator
MSLDLNLLLSLHALLQERNVTRAAQRLGLSQPTVSAALSRLRRHFHDELLTRSGNHYSLTPLAERLVEQSSHALSWTNRVFENRSEFDPATAAREFVLVTSDAQLPVLGRALVDLLAAEAPNVRLRCQHSTALAVHAPNLLQDVDALVLPQGILGGYPSLDLYRDRWTCVVAAAPGETPALDVDDLRHRPWVLPYASPLPFLSVLHRLRAAGVEPTSVTSTENFLAVPYLIRDTERIGLVPERVARLFAGLPGLATAVMPFELGILVESLWWHPMNDLDPGHVWFRDAVSRSAAALDEPY